MTRLILVRHGEAQGNIEKIYQGHTNGYLSPKGHQQAMHVAERLKNEKIDIIFSSPLDRTKLTASYTAKMHNLDIIERENLVELYGGDWENVPFEELPKKWPDEYNNWLYNPHMHKMPNGESFEELRDRFLNELLELCSLNKGKTICCFTHGTAIRSVMPYFHKLSFDDLVEIEWYDNTAVTIIDFNDEDLNDFELICAGDSTHLPSTETTINKQKWYVEYQDFLNYRRKMKLVSKLPNALNELKTNAYPGRGIVIGTTPNEKSAVIAYFIMGRSENSRNRVFVEEGAELRTKAFDESKLEDPSLIIYYPVRKLDNLTIVTNGDQTDTIFDFMSEGKTFEAALATRTFEPDPPNLTPRISGLVDVTNGKFSYKLSILKSFYGNEFASVRNFYNYEPVAGIGHFIHTYAENVDPLPSFVGEPKVVHTSNDIVEFAQNIWNNLDENNKISLFVRYIDIATDECETIIYNKNK